MSVYEINLRGDLYAMQSQNSDLDTYFFLWLYKRALPNFGRTFFFEMANKTINFKYE